MERALREEVEINTGEGATIYGHWNDVQDFQFIVMWNHSANMDCHVIMLSGSDYGGGVTIHGNVSDIELNKLLNKYKFKDEAYDLYKEVGELVYLSETKA